MTGSADDPLVGARGIIGGAGGGDLGSARHLGDRDLPPGAADCGAQGGVGGDDDDRCARLGPGFD